VYARASTEIATIFPPPWNGVSTGARWQEVTYFLSFFAFFLNLLL